MPSPKVRDKERCRTKKGRWRKKRSDVGKERKEKKKVNKMSKIEWLNRPFQRYGQYTYEIPLKALGLINRYGWFFDDDYFYYIPRTRKDIMIRFPLWMYPQKGLSGKQIEKYQRYYSDKQVQLSSFIRSVNNG